MSSQALTSDEQQLTRVVIFSLGREFYGINAAFVQEIKQMEKITPIPRTPDYLLGVVNLRSQVIPVMDLRRRFGMPDAKKTKRSRIIIIECGETKFGIVVDIVHEVAKVMESRIEDTPVAVSDKKEFISGVYRQDERLTVILDAVSLIPGKGNAHEVQG